MLSHFPYMQVFRIIVSFLVVDQPCVPGAHEAFGDASTTQCRSIQACL